MTKDKLMEGNTLNNEIKEYESNVKNLEKMMKSRQVSVRAMYDIGMGIEIDIPQQLKNAVLTLLSDYYRQRLAEAEEAFELL